MTRLFAALRAATLFFLLALPVLAQSESVDYDAWDRVASRAETALDSEDTSTDTLEELRSDVAVYRDRLLEVESQGDPRLETLQSQLEALGAPPEEGAEPEEIAQRRTSLQNQISELQAPLLQAEEAYNRADGIIQEIDEEIRSRQTARLLQRGPSPLNPTLWAPALTSLFTPAQELIREVAANLSDAGKQNALADQMPAILFLTALAALFLFRGPRLIDRLGHWLRQKTKRGTGVWRTILSFLRVIVPTVGLLILAFAVSMTGLLGDEGTQILFVLPSLLFVVLLARWLAAETFSEDDTVFTIALTQERRTEARYYVNSLSWLLALNTLLTFLSDDGTWSAETRAVAGFVTHVLCGLILFRLGQILRQSGPQHTDDAATDDEAVPLSFPSRLARLAGQGALLVGVLGPILSAIGYFNIAEGLIFPTIMTLGLFAFLLVCQRFARDVYHLIMGTPLDENQSLIPVMTGSVLTLISLPILALIWGARTSDLTELWARFQAGFSFGDTRISPTDFLTFLIVFMMGYVLTRLLQSGLRGSVLPKTKIDKGGQTAIVSGIGYLGIFLAAIIAITAAGIDLTALAFVAGALSVGIGFGLQNIVQNFVSGIILLIERPISEGDWIEVNGQHGTVRDISVRSTRIETFDRTEVIVPNADLVSNSVTNYTRGNTLGRLVLDVGVAYGTDTRKVEDILYRIARNHDMVLMNPEPFVHFKGFGADSLDFDVRMILRDVTKILAVRTEVNHQITEAFAKEGIEIPFAQRDIWLRNPEALPAGGAVQATSRPTVEDAKPPTSRPDHRETDETDTDAEGSEQ
jgi:small-conductance mechanosensitive channel